MTNAEIQVGEWIRTNNSIGIKKVARINEEATVNRYLFIDGYDHSDTIYGIIRTNQVINHSFNLLDLIEEGDFVNGFLVEAISHEEDENGNWFDVLGIFFRSNNCEYNSEELKNINIYSIVTKEQFESMETKVGEENE